MIEMSVWVEKDIVWMAGKTYLLWLAGKTYLTFILSYEESISDEEKVKSIAHIAYWVHLFLTADYSRKLYWVTGKKAIPLIYFKGFSCRVNSSASSCCVTSVSINSESESDCLTLETHPPSVSRTNEPEIMFLLNLNALIGTSTVKPYTRSRVVNDLLDQICDQRQ